MLTEQAEQRVEGQIHQPERTADPDLRKSPMVTGTDSPPGLAGNRDPRLPGVNTIHDYLARPQRGRLLIRHCLFPDRSGRDRQDLR